MNVKQTFQVLVEEDEEGWLIGSVPGLPGVHTQARTREELRRRIVEAIELYLEVKGPPPNPMRVLGIENVQVSV